MIKISPAKYSTGPSPYKFVLLAIVSRCMFPLSCPFHITFFISPTIFTSLVVCCALVVQLVKVKIVSPKSVALKFIFIIYFLLFLCRSTMRHNVLALGAVADFGAQNCQYTTKVDARQNVQLTTEPAIEPNACCKLAFCPPSLSSCCISVFLLSFYLLRFMS